MKLFDTTDEILDRFVYVWIGLDQSPLQIDVWCDSFGSICIDVYLICFNWSVLYEIIVTIRLLINTIVKHHTCSYILLLCIFGYLQYKPQKLIFTIDRFEIRNNFLLVLKTKIPVHIFPKLVLRTLQLHLLVKDVRILIWFPLGLEVEPIFAANVVTENVEREVLE